MAKSGSIILPFAMLGLAAMAMGTGRSTATAAVERELVSGPVTPVFTGLLNGDVTYPVRIDPDTVVAIFAEWRPEQGPVGATRIHLSHTYLDERIFVKEGLDTVLDSLGLQLVRVTWRPEWIQMLDKPSPEDKAEHHWVWINPKQVRWIGRSNIYSQEKRQVLGTVYLTDNFMLDKLLETWEEIQVLFRPYNIKHQTWRRKGKRR